MAGHSKFKNIMFRKGAQDKKRAKIFSKLGREIQIASKQGGIDPDSNHRLRTAIDAAKAANVPKDNIERAIKKGSSNEINSLEEIKYEGFGPGGASLIIETMTDNKNRTVSEIREIFSKNGGSIAENGSVSHSFKRKGELIYKADRALENKVFDFFVREFTRDELLELLRESFVKGGIEGLKKVFKENNYFMIHPLDDLPSNYSVIADYSDCVLFYNNGEI